MDLGLRGKNAIITGSGGGFGKALAFVLADEGANIVVHDLPSKNDEAEKICEELRKKGVNAEFIPADMSDEKAVLKFFEEAVSKFDIDILVNNAAVWPTAYVEEMSVESYRKTVDINMIAPFILCRESVKYFKSKNKKGKIVNMVSQAAFHGSTSGHAHYAASKAAMVAFTVSLARECAKYGINVNAAAPGMMRTPMNERALKEREEEYIKRIPIGRIAEPEEVANVVTFLCSDKSGYMTGATLDITGGMLMR